MGETDPNKLFLGKLYNTRNVLTDEKMFYNPSDLNTHCVITGMTGSGKTGLGILLLEEIEVAIFYSLQIFGRYVFFVFASAFAYILQQQVGIFM